MIFYLSKRSQITSEKLLIHTDILERHLTVILGMITQKLRLDFEEENLILEVDPCERTRLSIFYYEKEISYHISVEKLIFHIIRVLGRLRSKRKIIKIGNGNMKIAKQIATMLNLKFHSSFELEFVDERKTSLKIKNFNQRGKRDILSAKYISQKE